MERIEIVTRLVEAMVRRGDCVDQYAVTLCGRVAAMIINSDNEHKEISKCFPRIEEPTEMMGG